MMDIDDFKSYNDVNGHLAGDEVLRILGALLAKAIREGDTTARYGGEEFAVILPHTDKEGALLLAERLRYEVEKTQFLNEESGPRGCLTLSVGVACFSNDPAKGEACTHSKDELIRQADKALYKAKREGKNKVCT
jgi:diguanylate cyclase (GGDEF)-like protein